MLDRLIPLLLTSWCLLFGLSVPATAQTSNLDTVEGPSPGEKTTLMRVPRSLGDRLSVRALGVRSTDQTRWALTLIGASPSDSLSLTLNGEQLSILKVSRPEEGEVGPIQVYVSQETFLTIATTGDVRLRVGDTTTSFPAEVREEMQEIFDRVT